MIEEVWVQEEIRSEKRDEIMAKATGSGRVFIMIRKSFRILGGLCGFGRVSVAVVVFVALMSLLRVRDKNRKADSQNSKDELKGITMLARSNNG